MAFYKGLEMFQEAQDLRIWDEFFKKYPIKMFIEIGTGHGGFSVYMAEICQQRSIEYHTFDNFTSIDQNAEPILSLVQENAFHYHLVDIFSPEGQAEVVPLIKGVLHPLCIFFDNGNKPREWSLMAPLLSLGDFCAVHDWETEFYPSDIGNVPVEHILDDLCAKRGPGWKTKWFKRF
jgi:cephalosporin hydroxylase